MRADSAPRSLLLDTHTFLWWAGGDPRLSRKVNRRIQDPDTRVFISAATAWEIATKVRLGKLEWHSPDSVEAYCLGQDFELLPVGLAHSEKAGSWIQEHGDPFDRMLTAQSAIERIPLATNDSRIELFDVETFW